MSRIGMSDIRGRVAPPTVVAAWSALEVKHQLVQHWRAGVAAAYVMLRGFMTTNHDDHEPRVALTDDPAQHHAVYVAAFNTGDSSAVEQVYDELGVLVPRPGHPVTGPERVAATEHLLALGLPIDARPRHVYVADDIALLIVDWSIHGTAPDGTDVHIEGTATDVARRGRDGFWRYIIDNPFGAA